MAVRADELAVGDLRLNPFEAVTLSDQPPDLGSLRANVIELENRGICKPAVGASATLEDLDDVLPGDDRASLVEGLPGLASMEIPALADESET